MWIQKNKPSLLKIFSLLVILSLLLTSCVPSQGLEGTGGDGGTEEPAPPTEEPAPPTEEPAPPTEEPAPPTEEPGTSTDEPAPPTEPPATPTEEPPTEPPAQPVESPTATNTPEPTQAPQSDPQVQPTATYTNTPTPTSQAGQGNALVVPTATNTPSPTPQSGDGAQGNVADPDPYVGLGVACNNDLSATFTITNIGGPLIGGTYTVSEPGKSPVSYPLDLNSNQSISVNAAGNATVKVSYSTSQLDIVNLQAVGTCLPLPASTSTPTATATKTPKPTNTPGPTRTPTMTRTPTATNTPGPSPTPSNTFTPSPTRTPKPTRTPTSTPTPGPSPTPTNTKTPKPTSTATNTPMPSNTPLPTSTPVDGQLDLKVFCNTDQTATFLITNISGSVSDGTYVLSDPAQSGPVDLQPGQSVTINGAGNANMTVTYKTSFLSSVTLNVTGSCSRRPTPTPTATNDQQPPTLSVQGACGGVNTGTATFTITNNGGAMTTPYTYQVVDDSGAVVDSGTIDLAPGQNTTVTVSGNSQSFTFSSPNDASLTTVVDMSTCQTPPPADLTVNGSCTANNGTATFIVTNNGSAMTTPYPYVVVDATGALVASGTIDLGANQSTTVTYTGASPSYTFATPSDASLTTTVDMSACAPATPPPPPADLTVSGVCSANNGTATFTITNQGSDMTAPYSYVILDDNGAVAGTGTIDLAANQSVMISVTGASTSYTFATPNDAALTTVVDMSACVAATPPPPPVSPPADLSISGACTAVGGTAAFVLTNNGADMTVPYPYTITDASGAVVQTGTISLLAGQSITLAVNGPSTGYTFATPGDPALTTVADMTTCVLPPPPPPSLSANGVCVSPDLAEFTVTNNGGDMTAPVTFTITDQNGNVVQSGKIQLKAGESVTLQVTGPNQVYILNLTDAAGTTVRAAMSDCVEPITSVAPAEPDICIQCLVFHTFRDDNLEVYRLDGIEGQPGFKLYNLSKDEAVDSRPSRAPNDSWVVFQSNRDGNVELYYTDLLGSGEAIRLTETQANNTNPMYGPDAQTVVFQSDRNGRFDLFTIDQQSGEEVQITSNPADDVNPFFSPEIETLVFQSNRNGNWDLYVLDVETLTEKRLTDSPEDETFPAWSPNGKLIAYIVEDEDGGTNLFAMNVETGQVKQVTTDGKTVNAVWSPEGDRIAYQSERDGNLDVYSFDFRTNKEYRVTDYEGLDSGPTWDCGGTNLAFTSDRDDDPNIFQVFWQGGPAGNMTIDPATDKWSQWRPTNDVSSVGE